MKKNLNKKAVRETKKRRNKAIVGELSGITQERKKELLEMDRIAKMLIRRDLELVETREKREAELKELERVKAELENAKSVLEIKVKARTWELRELTQNLEEQVKERTKELQEKIEESQKMIKLMVGRELRMVELKKEIQKLKEKLRNKGLLKNH